MYLGFNNVADKLKKYAKIFMKITKLVGFYVIPEFLPDDLSLKAHLNSQMK